jgi:hypothetical protein
MANRDFTPKGAKKERDFAPKYDREKRAAIERLAFPTLSMVRDVSLAHKPKDVTRKGLAGKASEFIAPTRGFSDEETNKAKPKMRDFVVGTAKFAGEIAGGVMGISKLLGDKTGLNKLKSADSLKKEEELIGKINQLSQPKTAEEALAMRTLDIGTLGIGGTLKTLTKTAKVLSKTDDAVRITKELAQLGITNQDDLVKAIAKETRAKKIEEMLVAGQKKAAQTTTRTAEQATIRTADGIRVPVAGNKARFAERAKTVAPTAPIKSIVNKVRDTDTLAIKARNLIKDNPEETARILRSTRTDEQAVAVASEYIKKLADDAERAPIGSPLRDAANNQIAEITDKLARSLTEQGRAVQAASILTRNTPEGMLKFLQGELNKYNASTGTIKGQLQGKFKQAPDLTPVEKTQILERWRVIQKMPDGTPKAMEIQKFFDDFNRRIPTSTLKKVATVWRAGLLTGLKTTGLNVASNASHLATEILKDAPATLVDKLTALATGKRTKAFTVRGVMDGLKEGKVKGKRYFSTGFDERNIGEKLDYNKVNFKHKIFETYTETVFRVMGATDQPFYYASYARSMFDQALAQGMNKGLKGKELVSYAEDLVKNPTDEMVQYGVVDATTTVFQQDSRLADVVAKLQKAHPGMEFLIPFARTPSNVAMQIINYSALGFLKPVSRILGAVVGKRGAKKALKELRGKDVKKLTETDMRKMARLEKEVFDQRLFSQEAGRAIVGTSFMALGYKLMEEGNVSLGFPKGDEKMQELNKAEGKRQNSILIKFPWEKEAKWRSPMVLGPVGISILMGAHFQDAVRTSGSPSEAYMKTAAGTWRSFLEQTFLTSVNAGVQAMSEPDRYLSSYIANLSGSAVPTIVSDVARATDPYERITSTKDFSSTVTQRVASRVPGARQTLPKGVDVFGRTIESIGNPLEILMDPSRPSPSMPTPVTTEIRRIMKIAEENPNEDEASDLRAAMVTRPGTAGNKNGYESLSQDVNRQLWKYNGTQLNNALTTIFADERYKSATDLEKAKIIKKVAQASLIKSRAFFVANDIKGLSGDELKQRLIEHKDAGMLTEDVAKAMGF